MLITNNLRRQHTEILGLVSEIKEALLENPPAIEQIAKLVPELAGKISIHLAMEDNALYPKLLSSGEARIRETAAEFTSQMGDFKKVFAEYHKKWNSNLKIKDGLGEFSQKTRLVLAALIQRIEREEQELYDMADHVVD
jgi:hemerythrin-like domain-containing protein